MALVRAAVVVPVKAFGAAKLRLAGEVSPAGRAALARQMADGVLRAAGTLPVTVVCDDEAVATWAEAAGATVAWTPGLGLDGAVAAGVDAVALGDLDVERIVVAHADLPLATDLGPVVGTTGVLLVPDRRADGTNVISIPARCGFVFAYGPGSFARHQAVAVRLGLPVEVRNDLALGWDVDVPDDLRLPGGADLAAGHRA